MAIDLGNKAKDPFYAKGLDAVTATGAGTVIRAGQSTLRNTTNFRVYGSDPATTTAVVKLYGSNENATTNGVELATFTLSGGTSDVSGTPIDITWPYFWFDVISIGASTTVTADATVAE